MEEVFSLDNKIIKEENYDVIFAFSFGSPEDLISNHNIAKRAKKIFEDCFKTKFLISQKDIIFANPFKGCLKMDKNKILINIYILDINMKGYPNTLKLINEFAELAKKNNWKKVLVIAAPMHAKRCVKDLRKMGFNAYEDKYLRKQYNFSSIWWYNHNSTQTWTRSGLYWWSREIILRLLPWKIYEWITLR